MAHPARAPRPVAWRNSSDLLLLKNSFFPPQPSTTTTHDPRIHALSLVRALSVRARLPHSIESTSILTSAILADVPGAPALTLRLTYASAIIRFVNGLLDPAQQGQFALPMHQLARELGLDASFVEVRHAATHEELPSLGVLRKMAGRALEWLWWHYWSAIDAGDGETAGASDGLAEEGLLMKRAQMLVKRWRAVRKENPGKELKDGDQSAEAKEARAVVKEMVEMGKREEALGVLVAALLDVKALVPKGKKKEKLMGGAVRLWVPLLRRLEEGLEGFVQALVEAMLEVWREGAEEAGLVKEGGEKESVDKEYNSALVFWVKYFASGDLMKDRAPVVDVQDLAKECVLVPNEWSMEVLGFLSTAHAKIANTYGKLAGMAGKQAERASAPPPHRATGEKRSLDDMDAEISQYEEGLRRIQHLAVGGQMPTGAAAAQTVGSGRWKKWEGPWIDRPLGVVA